MNKVILVTGGSRGLGKSIVEKMSQSGDIVYFTYHNSQKQAEEITKNTENTTAIKCNQILPIDIIAAVETIIKNEHRIDVLVNNACSSFKPLSFLQTDWSAFDKIIDVNVTGTYHFMKECAWHMKKTHSGKILNIISSYVLGNPPPNLSFYVTAKYALLGMSKAAATELVKYGITVNMISPGLMKTELSSYLPQKYLEIYQRQHPMKRMTTTSDTADVIQFLISKNSDFLNGVNIPVNGGEQF